MNTQQNQIVLNVKAGFDGAYWVVSCPSLGMVAAHRSKSKAFMRGARMFSAQLLYALNTDRSLTGLFRDGFEAEMDALKRCVQTRQAFNLVLAESVPEESEEGFRFQIPDMATA